jgi:hypothetical protein
MTVWLEIRDVADRREYKNEPPIHSSAEVCAPTNQANPRRSSRLPVTLSASMIFAIFMKLGSLLRSDQSPSLFSLDQDEHSLAGVLVLVL